MFRFCNFTPNASAPAFTSFSSCALPGKSVVPKTAMRESLGTISLRSSSRFPLSSRLRFDNPVMFPWPRKAGDEAVAGRVGILRHNNGNVDGCFLGRTGRC